MPEAAIAQLDFRPNRVEKPNFFFFVPPQRNAAHALMASVPNDESSPHKRQKKKKSRGTDRVPGPSRGYASPCLRCIDMELHAGPKFYPAFLGCTCSYNFAYTCIRREFIGHLSSISKRSGKFAGREKEEKEYVGDS